MTVDQAVSLDTWLMWLIGLPLTALFFFALIGLCFEEDDTESRH